MGGVGGTPEGILAAAALRCLGGGAIQARLAPPRNDTERAQVHAAGHDPDRVLHTMDLVGGTNVFFAATGITDGALLRGVRYFGGEPGRYSVDCDAQQVRHRQGGRCRAHS